MRSITVEDAWIDQHLDLLQNIEGTIAGLYRTDPELEDWDASESLSALIKKHNASARSLVSDAAPFRAVAEVIQHDLGNPDLA